jgi:hypothetical protein
MQAADINTHSRSKAWLLGARSVTRAMLSLGLLLVAVGANSAETKTGTVAELPADPGAAGGKTLAGIDANGNGVRDDIELYVAANFGKDEKVMGVLANMAISFQHGMLATSDSESSKAYSMLLRSGECLQSIGERVMAYSKELQKIDTMLTNTPQREQAWLAHTKRLENMYFAVRNNPTWDDGCMKRVDQEMRGAQAYPRRE